MVPACALIALALASMAMPLEGRRGRPAGEIRWRKDYDEAYAEAKERNVPVVIIFVQDGEAQNEQMVSETLRDKDVYKVLGGCVNLIASRGTEQEHGAKKEDGVTVCKKYGSISCLEHQRVERRAFMELTSGYIDTPHTYVCSPDGTVLGEADDFIPAVMLVKKVKDAQKTVGEGMEEDLYLEIKATFDEAEGLLGSVKKGDVRRPSGTDLPEAIKLYAAIVKRHGATSMGKSAQSRLDEIDALGQELLKDAAVKIELEQWAEALRFYSTVAHQWKGTDLARTARSELKTLENRPEVKAALEAAENDQKAAELARSAETRIRQQQFDRGIREYRRLLKLYPESASAEAAKARLAEMKASPALKSVFEELDSGEAKRLMDVAETYAKNGLTDKAVEKFKEVLAEYPDTPESKQAKSRIAELGGGS